LALIHGLWSASIASNWPCMTRACLSAASACLRAALASECVASSVLFATHANANVSRAIKRVPRATIRFGSISWAGSRVSQIISQTSASHGDSRKSQSLTGNAPDLWPRHYIEIYLAQHGVERRPSAFLWIGRQPGQRRRPRRRRRAVSGRHGRAQAQTCAAAPLPRAGRSLMAISIASIKRSATSWEPSRSRTRESVIGDRMIQFVPLGNVLWFAPAPPVRTGREIAAGLPALSF
jgi:hypothetical protein